MKAAILTFHSAINFGAALQACALGDAVRFLGHDCRVIDYRPPYQGTAILRPVKDWRDPIRNGFALLHYQKMKTARERFGAFMQEEMFLTERYHSLTELQSRPPEADALICGSDQVWNTPGGPDPACFLQFGAPSLRRIAYAPSFGDAPPSPAQLEAAKAYLPGFAAVSVREAMAAEALSGVGIHTVPVLDPVLLHGPGYWRSLARIPEGVGRYILCYPLYNPPRLKELLRQLREMTGLPVVAVTTEPACPVACDAVIRDAGPREFLGWLLGAEMVVTSSFHGTALSVLMGKPFFAVARPSSRIRDLLERLALSHRLYEGGPVDPSAFGEDWTAAWERLREEREASLSFLAGALTP